MRTAIALLLALSLTASSAGAQPADAPVVAPVIVASGDTVPFDGLLLSTEVALQQAKRVAACDTERDSLRASQVSWPLVIAAVVGALAVGAAVGAGVAVAARR